MLSNELWAVNVSPGWVCVVNLPAASRAARKWAVFIMSVSLVFKALRINLQSAPPSRRQRHFTDCCIGLLHRLSITSVRNRDISLHCHYQSETPSKIRRVLYRQFADPQRTRHDALKRLRAEIEWRCNRRVPSTEYRVPNTEYRIPSIPTTWWTAVHWALMSPVVNISVPFSRQRLFVPRHKYNTNTNGNL